MNSLTKRINSYIAILVVTIVGSVATMTIVRVANGEVPLFASTALYKLDLP